jgi:hypothetical protein
MEALDHDLRRQDRMGNRNHDEQELRPEKCYHVAFAYPFVQPYKQELFRLFFFDYVVDNRHAFINLITHTHYSIAGRLVK